MRVADLDLDGRLDIVACGLLSSHDQLIIIKQKNTRMFTDLNLNPTYFPNASINDGYLAQSLDKLTVLRLFEGDGIACHAADERTAAM